uniref:Uncharacterized protein n=1 Tax=Arundo donax TaxID=35708 RepID=A0A0A8YDJ2_ARUDO
MSHMLSKYLWKYIVYFIAIYLL